MKIIHKPFKKVLVGKGFDVVADFYCKGFMNHGFTKYIFGGFNKKRPERKDLNKAREFAMKRKRSSD